MIVMIRMIATTIISSSNENPRLFLKVNAPFNMTSCRDVHIGKSRATSYVYDSAGAARSELTNYVRTSDPKRNHCAPARNDNFMTPKARLSTQVCRL